MAWTQADAEKLHQRRLGDFDMFRMTILSVAQTEADMGSRTIFIVTVSFAILIASFNGNAPMWALVLVLVVGVTISASGLWLMRRRLDRWVDRRFNEVEAMESAEFDRQERDLVEIEGEAK